MGRKLTQTENQMLNLNSYKGQTTNSTYPKGGVSCSKDSFEARKAMEKAAKDLDFLQAAKYRDEIKALQEEI